MALRLGDLVVRGEIFNTRKNSVHGYIQLLGHECPLMIELTGNCDPDLAGWRFRFEASPRPGRKRDDSDSPPPDLSNLVWNQIGPTGTMTAARRVRIFDCSTKEFVIRCELNEPPPTRWVRCLYLEWYSQNGRVVVELPDPIIEFVERVALPGVPMTDGQPADQQPPDETGSHVPALGITLIQPKDEGGVEIRHEVWGQAGDDDDADRAHDGEFGVVPQELQRLLDAQAAEADRAAGTEDAVSKEIREMELMDELIESDADEPLCSIFDKPMTLPAVEELDDKQAERLLKSLLAQLALCGVALHICEHFTAREAYRLLIEKVLWEERAYPQLRGTQWVQNIMTSEHCKECEAEAERDFEEYERRRRQEAAQDEGLAK
jgi:hypothetical protein